MQRVHIHTEFQIAFEKSSLKCFGNKASSVHNRTLCEIQENEHSQNINICLKKKKIKTLLSKN